MSTEYYLINKKKEDYINIGKMNNINVYELVRFFNRNNGEEIILYNDNDFLDFCNNELKKDVLKDERLRKIWMND